MYGQARTTLHGAQIHTLGTPQMTPLDRVVIAINESSEIFDEKKYVFTGFRKLSSDDS